MADDQPYDVGQGITLSCQFTVGATIGSMIQRQTTVYVRDPSGLDVTPGAELVVEEAGYVQGTLRTTVVSADGQKIVVADAAAVDASLVRVGTPMNPTSVTLTVRDPSGTNHTVATANPATGLFTGIYVPDADGTHYYRFQGTGSAAGDGWKSFKVRAERVPLP